MANEIISVEEVEVQPRGRKAELNLELVSELQALEVGQAIKLTDSFGTVPQSKRSTVAQNIRKHWKAGREDKCRIDWSKDGEAQVRVRVTADDDE